MDERATWPTVKPLVAETASLIARLYEVEDEGGPLHIVTDDNNVDDRWLLSCVKYCDDYSEDVRRLGLAILWGLSHMTVSDRAIAVRLFSFR